MKKLVIILIITLLFSSSSFTTVQAATSSKSSLPCLKYEDLSSLTIDETYSYDEVLADMQNSGILSKKDIIKFKQNHLATITANYSEEIRYSKFTMDTYTFKQRDFWGTTRTYNLTPIFYCGLLYVNGHYVPSKIVSLEGGHIYTGSGYRCIFGGTMFYRLEAGNSFYYGVYGDVYATGTTSIKAGAKVEIGESSSTSIEFTYSDNFIRNVDFDGRYLSAGLEP